MSARLETALQQAGHAVDFLTIKAKPHGSARATALVAGGDRLRFQWWEVTRAIFTLRSSLRRCRLAVATQEYLPAYACATVRWTLMRRPPLVAWVHCPLDEFGRRGGVLHSAAVARTLYRSCSRIVFVSDAAREGSRQTLGQLVDRLGTVIENWVSPADAAPPPDATKLADRLTARRLVFVGRLVPEKNVAFAIDVLSHLSRAGVACSLDIVGEGPQRGALEHHCAALGLRERVRFVGAVEDVARHLDGCTAFLSASSFEGFGLAMLEAARTGLPLFVTAFRGPLHLFVEDGVNGAITDSASGPPAMARRVAETLAHAELYRRYSHASWQRARDPRFERGSKEWLLLAKDLTI